MAIFGEFSELPFPEVLNMMGRRCGQLHIQQHGRQYRLHIDNDQLLAIFCDHQLIKEPQQVRDTILHLSRSQDGRFEFHKDSPNTLRHHYEFSITRLLLGASTVIDEISHYRDRLPSPDTRFVLLDAAHQTLEPELQRFIARTEVQLLLGASANDLARSLGCNPGQVQLMLYKLRTSGLIAPLRAQPTTAAPAPAVPAARTAGGLVARLLGALGGRRKGQRGAAT
ncbi:DUF4388 domain-containing protein [Deinococcus sonorensis]|uniref:DUF4388 domain-containing protein n=2 Tax=Deinococcus sonorensis TaxID=309891 RepID=A0AAU7UCM5_9DEIO